ncbi:MAG: hypothetical protein JNL08_14425 [Planctomycetes bacterium]|nr:hypothetical protein [Planctomycetota bacterium]
MLRSAVLASLLLPTLTAQRTAEGAEPNSTTLLATVLPCGAQGEGSLATAVDADWWRLTLTVPTELFVETMPGAGTQVGDTVLLLLDAGGAPLRSNDDGIACGLYSQLHVAELAAGTWYLAVAGGAAAVAGGSYQLDVRCGPLVPSTSATLVVEGPENNDPRSGGTPTAVLSDARITGSLSSTGTGGDWDFYRFLLLQPTLVRVRVDATATHPTTPRTDDPVLQLYADGAPPVLLASAVVGSDYGAYDAELVARLPAGIYQVAVRGFADSPAGSYYLDLRRVVAASASTNPGGCGGRTLDLPRTDVGPGAPLALERPVIGRTYTLLGSGLGSNGVVVHAFGVTPVLVDLTAFGAPGCFLDVVWIDLPFLLADAAGNAVVALVLAEDPSLLGVPLVNQLGVLDFSNPLGITTSNSVAAVMGH